MGYLCAIVGALTLAFLVDMGLVASGDCSIGALEWAIWLGFPIGGVIGLLTYKAFSRQFRKRDVIGIVPSLVISTATCCGGLFLTEMCGLLVGLPLTLLLTCVAVVRSYRALDVIAGRLRKKDRGVP